MIQFYNKLRQFTGGALLIPTMPTLVIQLQASQCEVFEITAISKMAMTC
jgi:hypothetical protein